MQDCCPRIYLRLNFQLSAFPDVARFFAAPKGYRSKVIDDANVDLYKV